ncbi:MAG: hypothetical protein U0Q16_08870 [Bryobacteraceae bacterium]
MRIEHPLLALFCGDTGGLDSWLCGVNGHVDQVHQRLSEIRSNPLSCGQLNQLLALAHQAEVSEGFFTFYWLKTLDRDHTYNLTVIPGYNQAYDGLDKITSLDQLFWGVYRVYVDCLLYFGGIRTGYRFLRKKTFEELHAFFASRKFDAQAMIRRGPPLPLAQIARDDRYLIAEMACKSFEPMIEEENIKNVLLGAWEEHESKGGGAIKTKALLQSAYLDKGMAGRQQQLNFSADEILEAEIRSKEELLDKYNSLQVRLNEAACAADADASSVGSDQRSAGISWVTRKGGPCDPTTQIDAGGTPASQLL